jgi:predicted ArsR family transcriptional regulator
MPLKRSSSQEARVHKVLLEGPATSIEVATELGMDKKLASAHLNNMLRRGVVAVTAGAEREACRECGHKPSGRNPQIYSLVDGRPR